MKELNEIWDERQGGEDRLSEQKLLAYMEGSLSESERHEVEKWLTEEGLESDALEGLRVLTPSEITSSTDMLKKDLRNKISARSKRRPKSIMLDLWGWLAILLVTGLCVLAYIVIRAFSE